MKSKFYYQNSKLSRIDMLLSNVRLFDQPPTSALSSIHSTSVDAPKTRPLQSKRDSQISILEKINSSKFKNIQNFDISNKIILPYANRSKYFVYNQDIQSEHQLKTRDKLHKYSQTDVKMSTFSPISLKNKHTENLASRKVLIQQKQNNLKRIPSNHKFLNPTQSWIYKITVQKPAQKVPIHNHSQSHYERPEKKSFAQVSIHEQLYLESRKKQIKRSAQQIIENEYFKKVHPFKPEVGQLSQLLAQQKRQKIKKIKNFEKEFEQFSQWRQKSSSRQKNKKAGNQTKDVIKVKEYNQYQREQTQLKNYMLLKQFFCYLSQNEPILSFQKLTPKKLCELPSACINLLEHILQQFYKNKKTKRLEWLQFLSEFNLKVQKKKAFYSLIEKWFWIKYKLIFDSKCKAFFVQNENCNKNENYEDQIDLRNEDKDHQAHGSRAKIKTIY